jgi:pimeloyl-ACP methyl ester carboxylesterase
MQGGSVKPILLLAVLTALSVTADLPSKLYTHAGHLVAVEPGRRLNLRCLGEGHPTVMMESGFGDTSMTWRKVQGQVAQITRACSYDRAGLGFSDAGRRPSTALNAADDLHRLVAAAGIQPPFVLVGHSAGGLYATVYAGLYGADIAGMVLVDPAFAEQDHEMDTQIMTAQERAVAKAEVLSLIADLKACAVLAHQGKLGPNTTSPANCLRKDPDPILNAEAIRESIRPKTQDALLSEALNFTVHVEGDYSESALEAVRIRHDFQAMPLIVLTRGTAPKPSMVSEETYSAREAALRAGHDRLAGYSTAGESLVIPNSSHYIQLDQPQAVIDAVHKVVEQARQRGPGTVAN